MKKGDEEFVQKFMEKSMGRKGIHLFAVIIGISLVITAFIALVFLTDKLNIGSEALRNKHLIPSFVAGLVGSGLVLFGLFSHAKYSTTAQSIRRNICGLEVGGGLPIYINKTKSECEAMGLEIISLDHFKSRIVYSDSLEYQYRPKTQVDVVRIRASARSEFYKALTL